LGDKFHAKTTLNTQYSKISPKQSNTLVFAKRYNIFLAHQIEKQSIIVQCITSNLYTKQRIPQALD